MTMLVDRADRKNPAADSALARDGHIVAIARMLIAIAAVVMAATVSAQSSRARMPDLSEVGPQVIEQTNVLRLRNGLGPVKPDARLSEAAQKFADFMANTERYGHEADARAPSERTAAAGYEHCMVAENIGYIFNTSGFSSEQLASRLIDGWTKSPGHFRNMLLSEASDIGIGVAQSERSQRFYAVQLFARPDSASTRFEVANRADTPVRYEVDGEAFDLPVRVTRTHTRCADVTLRILSPDEMDGTTRVRARNGARYVVSRDPSGRFSLQTN